MVININVFVFPCFKIMILYAIQNVANKLYAVIQTQRLQILYVVRGCELNRYGLLTIYALIAVDLSD